MSRIWYNNYDNLVVSTKEKRAEYLARCKILGANPEDVLGDVWHELVARAVKESNWQEGLKLDGPRTQTLATEALYIQQIDTSVRIDTKSIIEGHRSKVARMLRHHASREEVGAFNLSTAYYAIPLIGRELQSRQSASLAKALQQAYGVLAPAMKTMTKKARKSITRGIEIIEILKRDDGPTLHPLTRPLSSQGAYFRELLKEDFEKLASPMTTNYIHFLHRLTLTGLYPNHFCGRYRKVPVHVGLEDVVFPSPSTVRGLLREYCNDFPSLLSDVTKYEPILAAARVSYRFARIHPYLDGNGRVSRLLMNLVLWAFNYPPIYLKADKGGRHKYSVAFRRANRGDCKPLACLIATSINEIYDRLNASVSCK